MAKAARGGRWWRPGRVLGPAVLTCGLLAACGGGSPSAPTPPGPTPTAPAPSPEPVSGGFLHVLQGDSVVTYRIDAATGQVRPSATQTVGDAHTLTGEPQGRHVFAAFGPRGGPPYWDPSIVAYSPDPLSGSLTARSEASSDPIWCRGCASWGRSGGWYWLSASSTHVYGMWYTGTYHDTYHTYVAHAVGDDGQLGPAHVREFTEFDPERVAVDVGSDRDVFYKGTETGGLTAHLVQPDGSLEQMGASHLCGAIPLVAVRGFLFAPGPEETVCSFEGPRLAYRGTSELRADYPYYAVALALRDGASSSSPARRPAALVAMTTSSRTVRVFAMSDDGGLEPLDTVEPGYTRWMLFHPSGRFLYVSHGSSSADSPLGLTVYSIDADGHLAVLQTLEGGGGTMAVTLPQFPAGASAR